MPERWRAAPCCGWGAGCVYPGDQGPVGGSRHHVRRDVQPYPLPITVADPREANQVRWFALDDPAEWAHDRFDPHMTRFRDKLVARLGTPALVG